MSRKTPLYDRHVAAGARIVDFGGWDMPLHYGSQIDEHHIVRQGAGLFDVSHMTVADVTGADAREFLRYLLANDVDKLTVSGKGLYSCMLNESGGVIDDLIAYRRSDTDYRLVVNAATRDKDIAWMNTVAQSREVMIDVPSEVVMLAVQGPTACALAASVLPGDLGCDALELKTFYSTESDGIFVARTGYTGEDGFEIILDAARGQLLWDALLAAGVGPCGLGARDTLRMEAGLNLYGQDMDENTSPLVAGLGWTVAWEPANRDFMGRAALTAQRDAGIAQKFVGLVLEDRGIMRHGQRVITGAGDGLITSGGFSPTMQASIALARVPAAAGDACDVEIRKDTRRARVVSSSFVRKGQVLVADKQS
jgi:aminomethyltransferase